MPNSWRYLLGLIVQSEKCGLQIDMATFLYFFYMKPSEEGRYTLYTRRRIRLFEDALTSDKGWKDHYFFLKREGLCDPVGTSESRICSAWTERGYLEAAEQSFEDEDPSTEQTEEIPEGIPLLILEVPYLHISKAELEATKKKKRDKQVAGKGGASSQTDKGEEHPTFTVVVEPSSLPIVIPSGDSPPSKRQRRSSPPTPAQDKGKEKEMTLDEVGLEAEQNVLKLAQNARYSYEVVIKVDKAFKKKAEAYINVVAANKTLEENNLTLKQTTIEIQKSRLDYAQVAGERDALQARVALWPQAKKHIYKKAAIDAILKNTNDMIRAFKAGQTEDWVTPDPSDEKKDGQKDMEITSGEDELNDGDAPLVNQPKAP
ncbi:hypothetical protein FNV43_RR11138 [Rhamnella rubrinervis]|uniref:Uncharacterized protein n=1 Tax=Rhamnella rubrinervis TaxID=2594499 RepID=A0A8K0H594_9ROSA|nr:hypothetical protein FNV43_RR11138 [Rhamnella rubrinervis]